MWTTLHWVAFYCRISIHALRCIGCIYLETGGRHSKALFCIPNELGCVECIYDILHVYCGTGICIVVCIVDHRWDTAAQQQSFLLKLVSSHISLAPTLSHIGSLTLSHVGSLTLSHIGSSHLIVVCINQIDGDGDTVQQDFPKLAF